LEAERRRVAARGGVVVRGRVAGKLAVTRSLGSRPFRPAVSAAPEVASVGLEAGDEFVVLASDGLWGVLGDQEAVRVGGRRVGEVQVPPP